MKKKRKINIPAAKFGLDKMNGVIDAIPGAITTLSSPFQTSTATTGGEAVAQSISDIGSGMASGAQLGQAIGGPLGGVIGGAAGAAVGLIGKKGSEAEMASFTDYDEGSLGTGLIGAFTNKRLRRKRRRIANNTYGNRAAVQGTANLQSDWNETISAEYGGMIPESLVYADDGELIRTPYGDINRIPEKGRPTDSNLLSLPEGSRILSNTLKVPGTKKTFAEMGNKLINKRKSKYTDRYAENSQKLNDMNSQIAYDELFTLQEEVKRKRGIKPKTKELVQAAENGDVVTNSRTGTFNVGGKRYKLGETFDYKGKQYQVTGTNEATPVKTQNNKTPSKDTFWSTYDPTIRWGNTSVSASAPYFSAGEGPWSDENTSEMLSTDIRRRLLRPNANKPMFVSDPNLAKWGFYEGWSKGLTGIQNQPIKTDVDETAVPTKVSNRKSKTGGASTNVNIPPLAPTLDEIDPMYMYDYEDKELTPAPLYRKTEKPGIPTSTKVNVSPKGNTDDEGGSFDWTGLLSGIGQLAPALSNIFTSKPKAIEANYNPYSNAILNTMRRRRYNVEPALRDIRRNRAINNYNVNQANTSTGANLAFALQSAINADRAIADVRAQESNINNQYLGEYANAMNDLGQQWVNATNYAEDLNRKAQANARNIRRQGLSQISGILQNRELMSNQKSRDNAMLALYKPFLEAGFTTSDLQNMLKYIRRGGNNVG